MMKLSGKMILKVKSCHSIVNQIHVVFGFVSQALKTFIRNKLSDNRCCILILDVDIYDKHFILINLYNPNTESEQLKIQN